MESLPEGSQLTLQDAELQVTEMGVFVPTLVPNGSGWFGREGPVGYPSLFSPLCLSKEGASCLGIHWMFFLLLLNFTASVSRK